MINHPLIAENLVSAHRQRREREARDWRLVRLARGASRGRTTELQSESLRVGASRRYWLEADGPIQRPGHVGLVTDLQPSCTAPGEPM